MEKYDHNPDAIASASTLPRRDSVSYARKRIIKACTACKQSKVRCDANTNSGKPCSRCAARNLDCEVDAEFKRTPVRERMAAMAAELRQLRRQVKDVAPPGSIEPSGEQYQSLDLDAVAEGSIRSTSEPIISSRRTTEATIPYHPSWSHGGSLSIDPMYVGSTLFSTDEICSCIGIYHEHFHPSLPIVDATTPIGALQDASPLLIKTIIVIVCHRLNSPNQGEYDPELLAEEFQTELSQAILRGPISIHTIQALILLCNWPLPQTNLVAETSWLYCGVAVNGAKYLHLGRLSDTNSYHGGELRKSDLDNMNRTWLALFVVSTTIAALIGAPMPFRHCSDLTGIEDSISRNQAPTHLLAQAAICLIIARHSVVVYEKTDLNVHERLVRIHIDELDQIHHQYLNIWTEDLDSFLCYAKLHLHLILAVRLTKHNDDGSLSNTSNSSLPPETLTICSVFAQRIIANHGHVIGNIAGLSLGYSSESMTRASILTKDYYQRHLCANLFLLRFVCFNHDFQESDRNDARRHVLSSIDLFKRTAQSSRATEEHARFAELLEALFGQNVALQEPRMLINDRGSASILWDTLHGSLRHTHQGLLGTDLMELVDPTRRILKNHRIEDTASDLQMPLSFQSGTGSHAMTSMADENGAILWEEASGDLFNMDFTGFNDMGGVNTQAPGQP